MPSSSDSKIRKGAFRPNFAPAPSRAGLTYGAGVVDDSENVDPVVGADPWTVVLPLGEALAKAEQEVCFVGTLQQRAGHWTKVIETEVAPEAGYEEARRSRRGRHRNFVLLGPNVFLADSPESALTRKVRGGVGGKKGKYALTNIRVK